MGFSCNKRTMKRMLRRVVEMMDDLATPLCITNSIWAGGPQLR